MSKNDQPLPNASRKDEEAYAWVVRLESDQRTRQDELRFEQWLREDAGNIERFEEGLKLWDGLGALKYSHEAHAALGYLYETGQVQDNEPQHWPVSRRAMIGGSLAALAAMVAGVVLVPRVMTGGSSIYETAKGEQRRITLADGSMVMLDTATKIEVAIEQDQRLIRLVRGQAFFDVAHDPGRPFRVFAGSDEIRALGTRFEVRYEGGTARIILEEGKVAVIRGGALTEPDRQSANRPPSAKPAVILTPGQSTELASSEPAKVVSVDLSKTDAWRDGEMVFDDVPLSTAVAEVNRYGGRTVVLADPSLAKLHVSGTFHTNRPEAFVEGVTAALPVRLQQSDASKLVLSKI